MPSGDTSKKFDSVAIYRIRKLLSDLSNKTWRGTELVSLYLPPKKAVHEAIAALREESGTASNIKSDTTRNHVQDALTKTMARLRLYKQTPENGIVIFCGAIPGPGGPGNETIELFEVLPQKPVQVYLYRCVSPDTNILMDDRSTVAIRNLKDTAGRQSVLSFEAKAKRLVSSKITRHLDTGSDGRKTFSLKAESGREIVATEDHPFYTPRGWVALGELSVGDLVAVNPLDDLAPASPQKDPDSRGDEIIIAEENITGIEFAPPNIALTLRRLTERGLLPLTRKNPKLSLVARIMGHLFSDGSLTRNRELRNGKEYVHHTVDFCVGSEEDIKEISRDLQKLGVSLPPYFTSTHELRFADRSYVSRTLHAKLRDTALITLLRALGAPVGRKVKNGTKLPRWLDSSPLSVQREFLAAYMGGDSEAPHMIGSNPSSAIRLTFHRSDELGDQPMNFARELKAMFERFGVTINEISKRPSGYVRKDGLVTNEIELRFQLTMENVLKICHTIGYRYCLRKSKFSSFVGEYLRIKSTLRSGSLERMDSLRQLVLEGRSISAASKSLGMSVNTARTWTSGRSKSPIIRTNQIPDFNEWRNLATKDLGENLVWESIISKEPVQIENVMDLTIDSEDHSFIANGFLVHNCDDHFHLDPLRDMLREQNVIGILSMDATEAGLGIVSGDTWEVIDTMSSGVSGKTKKGGQCVSSDTLVQLQDGRVVDISTIAVGAKIASYDFANYTSNFYETADSYAMVPDDYFEVRTNRPQMKIRATAEHRFFSLDGAGVTTKQAHELKPGDRVLVSKKLPEPLEPSLSTRFPADFEHALDEEGRKELKQLRIQKGLSQPSLAKVLGLHQTEISQVERGERSLTWDKLQKIIQHLVTDPDKFEREHISTKRILPEFFTKELLQLLGYTLGDGAASKNRVSLYVQRSEVAKLYSELAQTSLHLDRVPVKVVDKREAKGSWAKTTYFETRIYSKAFVDNIRRFYPGIISSTSREIPEQIHRLDNFHLAFFLRGLFDAEEHVRRTRIGIAMKSGRLIQQLQLLLLRFGIVSSYSQNTNRFGTLMHRLDISDLASIVSFHSHIGVSAADKQLRLKAAAERKVAQSYLNAPVLGSWIDKRAKELKIRRRQFEGITNFFHDKRGISGKVFERVVKTFEKELLLAVSSNDISPRTALLAETFSKLSEIALSELVLATVASVQRKDNRLKEKFVDLELPETQSFIGNGFVLHNSARRYERLREMELSDYFRRLADHSKKAFLEQYQVKGLIVSGPGPTKDEFVKDGYLDYRLQNAVVGTIDSGYTGREGVRETIEKAGKLLENVRVVEEKKLVQRFLREVNADSGLAIYGIKDILASLKRSAVETILVNDDVDLVYLKSSCKNCGNVTEKFVSRSQRVGEKQAMLTCPNCGSSEVEISEKDIVDYLAEVSIDSGAEVEVISSKTEDGAMLKNFGGVSAILRYRG